MNKVVVRPLLEIVKAYDVLIFDIWGVLYDGIDLYPDTLSFLNTMIDNGKKIVFLSNTPRPSSIMENKFINWGLDMTKATIYTSGDALREQLVLWNDEVFSKLGKKFYHLGENRNKDILSNLAVEVTENIEEADFLLLSAYLGKEEDLTIHDSLLKQAVDLKLQAICPNPDLVAQEGNSIRYCAGTFAKKYEEFGGTVHYYGKPDVRIYNSLFTKHLKNYNKSKILMIGDTLDTDILGANRAEIDSVLVLTGNGDKIADKISSGEDNIFADYKGNPTWISDGVKLGN